MIRLPRETIERLEVTVTAETNPTSDVVGFAFTTSGRPSSFTAGTWKAASWDERRAVALTPTLGATGAAVVLAPGTYTCWVKVTDNPDVPVMESGTLTVT